MSESADALAQTYQTLAEIMVICRDRNDLRRIVSARFEEIIAAFDSNETALSLSGKVEILPISQFEQFCKEHNVKLGIITVGEGSAQTVCEQMVSSGIEAIWNFAPCKLKVPKGTLVQNENLALSLAHLNNQLSNSN